MFAYCNNNPVIGSDPNGTAPEWWQWAASGAMVIAGIALVATGAGGIAGGALICAGVNSIVGSYVSEASGGSSTAGWVGGAVSGAICGTGAGIGGALLASASGASNMACLGLTVGSLFTSGVFGAAGSATGTYITNTMNGKPTTKKEVVEAAITGGTVNTVAGMLSGMGNAIGSMSSFTSTSKAVANTLVRAWSVVSEIACDAVSTVINLCS